MSKANGTARVYSYIRFSTPEQAMGDSERRQLDDARRWAARNGQQLDDSLRLMDRGLSGYHGDHRKKGALGRFLERVEAGEIEPSSILLVENIDRLSREGALRTLREIIGKLWDHGIILQTLSPEETYEPGCDRDPKFIALLIYMQRAQDDSKRKSDLSSVNWKKKQQEAREQRKVLTHMRPAWLAVSEDGRFKPIPDAAEAIRTIFDLKLQGIGFGTIEQKLNAGGGWVPPLKKGGGRPKKNGSPAVRQQTVGWRVSYIKKILANPAVIGEYQPYRLTAGGKRETAGPAISGYFPAVVSAEVFHAVKAKMEANRGKGGRTAQVRNLLAHLAKCGYCGGPMAFSDRGAKGDRWLICDNGRRGVRNPDGTPVCTRHSMKYEECERLILDNLPGLRPEQVLPNPDEQAARCRSLQQRIQGKEAELSRIEKQIGNLIDQIAATPSATIRNRYEARVKELEERKAAVNAEKESDEAELRQAENSVQSFDAWKRGLAALKRSLKCGNVDVRLKLRSHLRDLIERIEVFADGDQHYQPQVIDRTGGEEVEPGCFFNEGALPLSEAEPFMAYVNRRLASREGRFVRVFFKTWADLNLGIDLAPDGSLAEGMFLLPQVKDPVDQWSPTQPGFLSLWRDYVQECIPADARSNMIDPSYENLFKPRRRTAKKSRRSAKKSAPKRKR
jgi:DNA invertase Pin-like site-specific DNA recombinase